MARVLVLGALLALALAPTMARAQVSPPRAAHIADVGFLIEPKPPTCTAVVSPRAYELIVAYETGGRRTYERKYQRPVWPGRVSGVTIGIGYDLGHASRRVIEMDWQAHPQRPELPRAAGITGRDAIAVSTAMQHVVTRLPLAERVFSCTSVIEYYRMTRRAFGGSAFDRVPPNAQGALVSLVYNRGAGMKGSARLEMREIRDRCIPDANVACIAAQLRAMTRVWRNTDIEAGMAARRESEARLSLVP